jgi:signal transduction histidine kinase
MNSQAYAFLGLAMILSVLVAVLVFAVLRFGAAARDAKKNLSDGRMESVLLSSALEDAITKLKAQERATAARAEASERLSGQIVASLTSGLLVVDKNNRLQIVNPAARRILQLAEIPPPDADYRTVLAGADELTSIVAEALRENVPIIRRTITIRGARPTHLGVTVSPLTPDEEPSGIICLFTDLTNVVALEDQLRLKDSLARLGELTAGLAHEFRNGLATIHGYARLFDPQLLPEQYRPYVEGIRGETQALGEVVTNFLKFARPDPLTFAPVDLRTLISRAAEDVSSARIELRGEFATIEGDEVLLRQAFSNLFRNSVEASAAPAKAPHIVVESHVDAATDTTNIDVSDDGPGIQADALGHIFQPFFTTRAGGTGLGLAIVQKVVVSHNGLISAGNRPEGGAIFNLSFPLHGAKVTPNL